MVRALGPLLTSAPLLSSDSSFLRRSASPAAPPRGRSDAWTDRAGTVGTDRRAWKQFGRTDRRAWRRFGRTWTRFGRTDRGLGGDVQTRSERSLAGSLARGDATAQARSPPATRRATTAASRATSPRSARTKAPPWGAAGDDVVAAGCGGNRIHSPKTSYLSKLDRIGGRFFGC